MNGWLIQFMQGFFMFSYRLIYLEDIRFDYFEIINRHGQLEPSIYFVHLFSY